MSTEPAHPATDILSQLQEETGYSESEDGSVDDLIAYKNALEDYVGSLREIVDGDEIVSLPSGSEISTNAAIADLRRAQEFIRDYTANTGDTVDGLICDLEHVIELVSLFRKRKEHV